jgi:hypothetical protein
MYYSISPSLPLNETALRIIGIESPDHRLFWRGDIVIARFGGVSSYLDAGKEAVPAIENAIRNLYESAKLNELFEQDRAFCMCLLSFYCEGSNQYILVVASRSGPELPRHRIMQEEMAEIGEISML